MDRREFNQALGALGVIATLPGHAAITAAVVEPGNNLIRIGLVSIGGANGNSAASIAQGLRHVTRTIAIDTDAVALSLNRSNRRVLIGDGVNKLHHPHQTREMAWAHAAAIEATLGDLDLVFIHAVMSGAAGKGIAPVVADIAMRSHIVTIGIASSSSESHEPEPSRGVRHAIEEFQRAGVIVFPIGSQPMGQTYGDNGTDLRWDVRNLIAGISHAVTQFQIVGIDLEDIKMVLEPGGIAAMGFGSAEGTDRWGKAVQRAIEHAQLGMDRLLGATGVLVNVRGLTGLNFKDVNKVWQSIRSSLPLDPWFLYSGSVDESAGDNLIVSIFATVSKAEICRTSLADARSSAGPAATTTCFVSATGNR